MPYDQKKFEAFKSRSQTPSDPASTLMDMWNAANTKDLQNAPVSDLAADAARGGQYLQKNVERGSQDMVNMLHQKLGLPSEIAAIPGAAVNTFGEYRIPQTRLGVYLSLLPGLAQGVQAAKGGIDKLRGVSNAASALRGEASGLSAAAKGSQADFHAVGSTLIPRSSLPQAKEWSKALNEYQDAVLSANKSRGLAYQSGNIDEFEKAFANMSHPDAKQMEVAFNKLQSLQKANPELSGLSQLQTAGQEGLGDIASLGSQQAAQAAPQAVAKAAPPGQLAQMITARAGRANGKLTPQMAQYAINNPKVLDEAPSLEKATAGYKEAIGGLKGKTQALSERLNKTVIRPGDYDGAIDRAGRILSGTPLKDEPTKLDPQEALTGLQSINQAMRDRAYTQGMHPDQQAAILKVKEGLLDFLQNNGSPKIRSAGKQLYEAHIKDAFSSWLPQNKFGSPDALRTTLGMGQFGAGASEALAAAAMGHPGAGILGVGMMGNAALSSPRVSGQLIREYGALRNPATWQGIQQSGIGLSNALGNNEPRP